MKVNPVNFSSIPSKLIEKFEIFLSTYFGASYVKANFDKWLSVVLEILFHLIGGYSGCYCAVTWNDETLKNDANLEIFDLLYKIDIKNGADPSKIVHCLCIRGAFEAVKVKN